MNSYHEIERFQRKAGQDDFPFRNTGAPDFEHPKTGWSLIDQVAADVSSSPLPEPADISVDVSVGAPVDTDVEAQDAALDHFVSLLQARRRREVEQTHPEAGDEQSLKQLLRRIAVGFGETSESRPTQC